LVTSFSSEKVKIHEAWDHSVFANDIGLLLLNRAIDFAGQNSGIQCVCEPELLSVMNLKDCMALGWGRTTAVSPEGGTRYPDRMREVRLPIWGEGGCKQYDVFRKYNPELQLCAGTLHGGRDTCNGDSGKNQVDSVS